MKQKKKFKKVVKIKNKEESVLFWIFYGCVCGVWLSSLITKSYPLIILFIISAISIMFFIVNKWFFENINWKYKNKK